MSEANIQDLDNGTLNAETMETKTREKLHPEVRAVHVHEDPAVLSKAGCILRVFNYGMLKGPISFLSRKKQPVS